MARSPSTVWMTGAMVASATTVDTLMNHVLPITVKHLMGTAALVPAIVATHRLCGFIVQPLAAKLSDHHRGRHGRRRPFFLWALPVTIVCVGLFGALPFAVPPGLGRSGMVLAALLVLNVGMLGFQAVSLGCTEPLYADLFAADELGRVCGVRQVITHGFNFAMALVAIPLADRNAYVPYAFVVVFLTVGWFVALFFLREPPAPPPPPRRDLLGALRELRDPQYAWIAVCASIAMTVVLIPVMLNSLFVTETLGLTQTQFGHAIALGIALTLLFSYPIGALTDRVGPWATMALGYCVLGGAMAGMAFFVRSAPGLYLCVVPQSIGNDCLVVPITLLVLGRAPADRRGSIFAAVQAARAATACVATLAVGQLATAWGSYRTPYQASIVGCGLGIVVVLAHLGRKARRTERGVPAAGG